MIRQLGKNPTEKQLENIIGDFCADSKYMKDVWLRRIFHCVKTDRIQNFSGPHIQAWGDYVHVCKCVRNLHAKIYNAHEMYVHVTCA